MAESIKPEWIKLREEGWEFTYSKETRCIGACHATKGGKFTICEFERQYGDKELMAHQIGYTICNLLND